MRNQLFRLLPLGLVLPAMAVAGAAEAQVSDPFRPRIGTGVGFESYSFSDASAVGVSSLSLLTAPFGASVGIFGGARVGVSGAYARGTLERADGSTAEISGMTDTEVRLDVPVLRNSVILTAAAAAPTGHVRHTEEEAQVAGAFASDLLPFRVSNWGTGGGFGFAAAFTRAIGETAVGLSAGYSVAREFEPMAADDRFYQPGNEARVRFAIDRNFGRSSKLSLQLGAQRFSDDQLGGENLYRSGDRFTALGSYAFATGGRSSAVVYGGAIHRTEGTFLLETEPAPAQDLLLAGGGLRIPFLGGTLFPGVDGRVFRRADGVGQGYSTGAGASLELPAGALAIVPALRGRYGSVLVREGAESGFTGFDASLMIRLRGAGR